MTFLFKPQRRSRNRVSARILPWASFRTVSVAYQFERTATIHCVAPGVHLNLSNGFTLLILRSKISLISLHLSFFAAPSQYFERAAGTSTTQLDRGSLLHQKDFQTSHIQKICTKPNSQTVQIADFVAALLTKPNICAIMKKIIREQTFLADRALCGATVM